ncbi:MAG: choice-of-anchor H family protein [Pseudomonadota bacterium]
MKVSTLAKALLIISFITAAYPVLSIAQVKASESTGNDLKGKTQVTAAEGFSSKNQESNPDALSTKKTTTERISEHIQHPKGALVATENAKALDASKSKETEKRSSVVSKHNSEKVLAQRGESVNTSSRWHDFTIYDAKTYLNRDVDGDGFYSEFEVVFDADTSYDAADVYGVLYISRNGGPWEFYYETDVFRINGNDSDDEYSVRTTLNFNFPSGQYSVLIDLYEYGYSGVAATISSSEDGDLYSLPLEDITLDTSSVSGFDIHDISTTLITDNDGDGYFSEFAMSIDIDSIYPESLVYAEIYYLNRFNEWELEFTSNNVAIYGEASNDSIDVSFEWHSGYPTRHYDFKVVVIDAYTHQRLFETGRNYNGLNTLPLESADSDRLPNIQPPPSGGSSSSIGSGGGSMSISMLGLLCVLFWRTYYFTKDYFAK